MRTCTRLVVGCKRVSVVTTADGSVIAVSTAMLAATVTKTARSCHQFQQHKLYHYSTLQGSVATRFGCGGIANQSIIANSLLSKRNNVKNKKISQYLLQL